MRKLITVGLLVKKTRVKNSLTGTIRRNSVTVGVLTRKTRLMNSSRRTMMKKNDSCTRRMVVAQQQSVASFRFQVQLLLIVRMLKFVTVMA